MKRSEQIKQYILEHGEQMIADTICLAEHQSPTIQKEYVEKCADAITELIRNRLGLEPTAVYPQEERGRHLYYRIGEGRPKALMLGHYDTVWNIDDLPLKRECNKLSGPGVYDMKYGIVAGIWVIKALLATGGLDGCIGLFLNSDEEKRLQQIFAIADTIKYDDYATVTDWNHTAVPSKFNYLGKEYNYNWYKDYEGSRHFVSWMD